MNSILQKEKRPVVEPRICGIDLLVDRFLNSTPINRRTAVSAMAGFVLVCPGHPRCVIVVARRISGSRLRGMAWPRFHRRTAAMRTAGNGAVRSLNFRCSPLRDRLRSLQQIDGGDDRRVAATRPLASSSQSLPVSAASRCANRGLDTSERGAEPKSMPTPANSQPLPFRAFSSAWPSSQGTGADERMQLRSLSAAVVERLIVRRRPSGTRAVGDRAYSVARTLAPLTFARGDRRRCGGSAAASPASLEDRGCRPAINGHAHSF